MQEATTSTYLRCIQYEKKLFLPCSRTSSAAGSAKEHFPRSACCAATFRVLFHARGCIAKKKAKDVSRRAAPPNTASFFEGRSAFAPPIGRGGATADKCSPYAM